MKLSRPKPKMPFEQRFPTKLARDAADAATDVLMPNEPMTRYIDLWFKVYAEHGGIDKWAERTKS